MLAVVYCSYLNISQFLKQHVKRKVLTAIFMLIEYIQRTEEISFVFTKKWFYILI